MRISEITYVTHIIQNLIQEEGYEPIEACKRARHQAMTIKILGEAGCSPDGAASRLRLNDVTREITVDNVLCSCLHGGYVKIGKFEVSAGDSRHWYDGKVHEYQITVKLPDEESDYTWEVPKGRFAYCKRRLKGHSPGFYYNLYVFSSIEERDIGLRNLILENP